MPSIRSLRRLETKALLLLMGAAAAIWAFVSVGGEVMAGDTMALDRFLLLMLRSPGDLQRPIGSLDFAEAMRDVTALGGFTVLTAITVAAVAAFLIHHRPWHALVMGGTVLLARLSSAGLKALYGRPRPDLVPHGSYVYSASFPSGHSMLAAATFFTLAMLVSSLEPQRASKVLAFVLATSLTAAVGFSRVYLGVHWPTDVLAGWCGGVAWAFAAWVVVLQLGRDTPNTPSGV